MPTGKLFTLHIQKTSGVYSLIGLRTADFTHDSGASTQMSSVTDDVAMTADDRYTVKIAYPSTALPSNSLQIANLLTTAQVLIEGVTVPGAPTIGTATAGAGQVTVTFTAPGSTGGSPITSYTVTSNTGGFTASGSASPLVVNMGADKTAHTFTVTATNVAGTGAASAASNSVSAT